MNWIIEILRDGLTISLGMVSALAGGIAAYLFAKKNKLKILGKAISYIFFIPLSMLIAGWIYPYVFTSEYGSDTKFEDMEPFLRYSTVMAMFPFAIMMILIGTKKTN